MPATAASSRFLPNSSGQGLFTDDAVFGRTARAPVLTAPARPLALPQRLAPVLPQRTLAPTAARPFVAPPAAQPCRWSNAGRIGPAGPFVAGGKGEGRRLEDQDAPKGPAPVAPLPSGRTADAGGAGVPQVGERARAARRPTRRRGRAPGWPR